MSLKDVTNQKSLGGLVKKPSVRDAEPAQMPPLSLSKASFDPTTSAPELPTLPQVDDPGSPTFVPNLNGTSPPGSSAVSEGSPTQPDDTQVISAASENDQHNSAGSFLGPTETFARIAEFIECGVPEALREPLDSAIQGVLNKLGRAVRALETNDDIYFFRDYHGSLLSVYRTWQETHFCQPVSSVWVVDCLLPLLEVLCYKPVIEGIAMIALYDILTTVRFLAVALPHDSPLTVTIIEDCWPRLQTLMASDQAEVAFQSFRTAKLIMFNVPITEAVLQVGNGFGSEPTGCPDIDERLYRYRLDIFEVIVEKVETFDAPIDDGITIYLMRYANQLEQAKARENHLVLLRQIQDVSDTIKRILRKATPTSPVLMRGRYYPTLVGYPSIGDHCVRPAPEPSEPSMDMPVYMPHETRHHEPHSQSFGTVDAFDQFYSGGSCGIESALFRPPSPDRQMISTLPAKLEQPVADDEVSLASSTHRITTWFRSLRSRRSAPILESQRVQEAKAGKRSWFFSKIRQIFHPFQPEKSDSSMDIADIDTTLDIEIPNWKFQSWKAGYTNYTSETGGAGNTIDFTDAI